MNSYCPGNKSEQALMNTTEKTNSELGSELTLMGGDTQISWLFELEDDGNEKVGKSGRRETFVGKKN